MSISKPMLVATTAVSIMVAAWLWVQLHAERARSQLPQVSTGLVEPRDPAGAGPSQASEKSEAGVAEVAESATVAPASAATSANAAAGLIDGSALLVDPDYRKAQLARIGLQVRRNLPDLASELGLSGPEAEALFDLVARQQAMRLERTGSPDDLDRSEEEVQRMLVEQEAREEAEIRDQLGIVRYERWQQYQETLAARQRVATLRASLAATAYPLTEEQARPLLEIVAAEQKRRAEDAGMRSVPTDPRALLDFEEQALDATEASYGRVVDAARAHLVPAQIAAMQNSMTQQVSMQRALLRARRAAQQGQ